MRLIKMKSGRRATERLLRRNGRGKQKMMHEKISVILPCMNEAERLPPTLAEIEQFCKDHKGWVSEVICVDDGSTDATVEVAMQWSERIPLRIERLVENKGKWAAIHYGMRCAANDALLLLDADGSASIYELERIRNLVETLEAKRAVFGSRFLKSSSVEGKTALRKCISWGYKVYASFWYWYATGRCTVDDMQCPFKIVYKSLLTIDELVVNRFAGDIELACNSQAVVVNHPVQFLHRAGSKLPFSAIFSMAWETMWVAVKYRIEKLINRRYRDGNI